MSDVLVGVTTCKIIIMMRYQLGKIQKRRGQCRTTGTEGEMLQIPKRHFISISIIDVFYISSHSFILTHSFSRYPTPATSPTPPYNSQSQPPELMTPPTAGRVPRQSRSPHRPMAVVAFTSDESASGENRGRSLQLYPLRAQLVW